MNNSTWLIIVGVIILGLVPIAPYVLRFRIRVLRFLHLFWLADWHERNFKVLVVIARIILAAIAIVLLCIGTGVF